MDTNPPQPGYDKGDNNRYPPPTPPTPPAQAKVAPRPNILVNLEIHNDQQNDIANVFQAVCLENYPPEQFRRGIVDSTQNDDLAHSSFQYIVEFIRRICPTLEEAGLYTKSLSANKNNYCT